MKSINAKKKNEGLPPVLLAVVAVVMVLTVVFTCAHKGIINIPGISPAQADAPVDTIQIAYTNAAVGAGTDIADIVTYQDIPMDENTVIPDDALMQEDMADYEGYVTKIDLQKNTPLTKSMICPVDTDNKYNDTTREVDLSYIDLQGSIQEGDYVDIRLKTNNSAHNFAMSDDIVVAKKEVVALNGKTVTLRLNEDEQILLTAAAVDMTITNATKAKDNENKPTATLYTTKYVSNAQTAADITYHNDKVVAILRSNPNLINNPTALYEQITGQKLTTPQTSNADAIQKDVEKQDAAKNTEK